MKKYRFFYHYYKQKGKMSVHFRNKCYVTDNVECNASCQTKWNSRQPHLIMQGFAQGIIVDDNKIIIK